MEKSAEKYLMTENFKLNLNIEENFLKHLTLMSSNVGHNLNIIRHTNARAEK